MLARPRLDVARPDRASSVPLWAQVAADLRRRLSDGEFADRFPGELTLVEEYGVSRHTVREALRDIRREGLVVAARGRGSYAAEGVIAQSLDSMYSLFRSLEGRGIEQVSEVRRLEVVADPTVAERLGLPPDARLVLLERRRLADGHPLAMDRAWLPASLAEALLEADFSHTALYDELAARCGLVPDHGQERITAAVPSEDLRTALDLPGDAAVLRIERLGRCGELIVEWRETFVRGDRFHVLAQWSQSGAPSRPLALEVSAPQASGAQASAPLGSASPGSVPPGSVPPGLVRATARHLRPADATTKGTRP